MDEQGEFSIPVYKCFHLDKDIVGINFKKYDSILVLSHFKGHEMAGCGGALKNISIGIASTAGKAYIHSAGETTDSVKVWSNLPKQNAFLESMADACKVIITYKGMENMAYINVANRLSIDCDCNVHPKEPEMNDIGLFASLDPVALDKACYDAVMNSNDQGKASLVKRMLDKHAIRTIEVSYEHGLGSLDYQIISLD